MKKFAELISYHIKRKNFTKVSLGAKVGLSDTYFTMFEKGETPPPFETCKKISDALSLTPSEQKEFFEAAYVERNKDKDKEYKNALGVDPNLMLHALGAKIKRQPSSLLEKYANEAMSPVPLDEHPLIEWKDLLSPDIAKGGNMLYALKIENNEMEPKFQKGDVIHVQIGEKPKDGKYVIAKGKTGLILRLYKKYGNQIVLQRLVNAPDAEIRISSDNQYEIIGVVKKRMNIEDL